MEGGRKPETLTRGQNSSTGFPRLSFSLALLVGLSLILTPLIALTVLSRTAGVDPPDLSSYPWIYLRADEPLDPEEDAIEVIAVGDVQPGRGIADEPFDGVQSWLRAADLTVGNLESVIVRDPQVQSGSLGGREVQPMLHASPSVVAGLRRAGFDVLGVANNHALDLGSEGLEETASHLRAAGIDVSGAGPVDEGALQPLIREVRGIRLAFLAFNGLSGPEPAVRGEGWLPAVWNQERATAAVAAAGDRADAVIVSIHWGYEYETRVDPAQRDAARALLEAGADLVIGHHPHVVQVFEVEGKRAVGYSLGNFLFDQQQGETRRGLALRAFFDREGLRAVQALPVWAGPRPRLMNPEDASSLLERVGPPAHYLIFICEGDDCRPSRASACTVDQTASGVFWGGSVDLTGDGVPEHVRRVSEQVIIYQDGVEAWRSPSTWRVVDLALGDPNDDGRSELMLAIWKPGLDGLELLDTVKRDTPRSRPFMVGYRRGRYRTLWGGSAVAEPIQELELGDVDGDGTEELIVLEGENREERTVSVWRWHGWGFSLIWRSGPGQYGSLTLGEDGSISVTVE
jgi:poly-gamma-glutamate synthesis protein (capsule biosynthesis protein)